MHAISGGKTRGACAASACPRCVEGPELTDGVWVDICTPIDDEEAWESALEEMSKAVVGFETTFPLRAHPVDKNGDGRIDDRDLEVRVEGRLRKSRSEAGQTVWCYDEKSNSIAFTPLYFPKQGEEITVTYEATCR